MAITATTDALQGAQDQANSSTSTQSTTAAAAVYKRLHPQQYLSRFLAKGYRPDGRRVNEFREASLNTGSVSTADGSSLVRLGSTTVVCGIKAEIAEPTSSSPDQGYLIPNVDLPALCSPRYKPGPPSDEAQVLSVWLYDLLISSRVVDLTSLCIVPGKAVWALYIDVVCINYDGNAFDAAVLAVMAALKNTKLHGARYNDETGKVNLIRGEKYSLKLGRIPLAASFGIFNETHLLPDPTSFESPHLSTTISICLDESNRACMLRSEGLTTIGENNGTGVLSTAWVMAERRITDLRDVWKESS